MLDVANECAPGIDEVETVLRIAEDQRLWPQAPDAFTAVRRLALSRQDPRGTRESLLLDLAELTAKVTYNASGEPAPFDHVQAGTYLGPQGNSSNSSATQRSKSGCGSP